MLIVSKKGTNGGYSGRFVQKARDLVKAGTRVGMMHVDGKHRVHCHVCKCDFDPPAKEPGFSDAWGECPSCHTPFIFDWIMERG